MRTTFLVTYSSTIFFNGIQVNASPVHTHLRSCRECERIQIRTVHSETAEAKEAVRAEHDGCPIEETEKKRGRNAEQGRRERGSTAQDRKSEGKAAAVIHGGGATAGYRGSGCCSSSSAEMPRRGRRRGGKTRGLWQGRLQEPHRRGARTGRHPLDGSPPRGAGGERGGAAAAGARGSPGARAGAAEGGARHAVAVLEAGAVAAATGGGGGVSRGGRWGGEAGRAGCVGAAAGRHPVGDPGRHPCRQRGPPDPAPRTEGARRGECGCGSSKNFAICVPFAI